MCRLKRLVEISVCAVPERWAGRCLVPRHFVATIVANGPRSMRGELAQGRTADTAVRVVIDRMKAAGYTGTARVEGGGVARPPWG